MTNGDVWCALRATRDGPFRACADGASHILEGIAEHDGLSACHVESGYSRCGRRTSRPGWEWATIPDCVLPVAGMRFAGGPG